ncbi:hypothetical protein EV189_1645 [Motilibacter rhizosphaerae]|uniref:Uncharacterized protein n=1 Tax=Motilibacter rhizosphaerae TaxID=598652 RepID=A0A4V2F4M8_9ACTN|nr:hypothetical protein [Motilibacter rhizosphaerae]RZS89869.1 hypothetical protein EV189_1645 [Motilibacter rhizosphaerae]
MRTSTRTRSLVATAAAAAGVLVPATAHADTTTPACDSTPGYVQGQPDTLKAGATSGAYLWADASGWHFRVTHPGKAKVVFTGRITSSQPMTVTRAADEKGDRVWLSLDRKSAIYRFTDYGQLDGLDLTTACGATLKVGVRSGKHELDPQHVFLGRHDARPKAVPFVIRPRSSEATAPAPKATPTPSATPAA